MEGNFGKRFKIAPIPTRLRISANPLANDPLVRHLEETFIEHTLFNKKDYELIKNATIYTCYAHPFCKDIRKYVILVRFMLLFFVYDDHSEQEWGDGARQLNKVRKM